MIPFFRTTVTGNEGRYVNRVLENADAFAAKEFTQKCEQWFNEHHGIAHFFLTKSCTASLELAALTLNIQPGDEVIMPSFAFVSCANAFALRGAVCVFVDVSPTNMNLDAEKVEAAITSKTKAIVTVNYASVACNYTALRRITQRHNLFIVEDNAHGTGAKHNNDFLGTFGDIATFSFDHLKNITCGQGGGIAINNKNLLERFYVAYEFGTNRRSFFNGQTDRYEWKGLGSNFPLSELNAAMLFSQLEECNTINTRFVQLWNKYFEELSPLAVKGKILLPQIAEQSQHNGHCFYLKTTTAGERNKLIAFLQDRHINAQFHYTTLHGSAFGKTVGRFVGNDDLTAHHSAALVRLPLFYSLKDEDVVTVVDVITDFYAH
ncbi:MAG: dTDP-4-amino-4,6-dideoxygalactose transaminase [Chitinophagales bacterium]|nr:dTDP-4-amino-4,6-dideoxygalactose transaminase [Chitinophagales bacterium]